MKHVGIIVGISLFAATLFGGCEKEEDSSTNSDYDSLRISFNNIIPTTAIEYADSISITISYFDPDGDLGENEAGAKNLFITDSRNNVTYEYRIQQLAPDNASIAIQGELTAVIKNTALTNSSATSESLTYSIYVKDRAGNQSNTVVSSSIIVTK